MYEIHYMLYYIIVASVSVPYKRSVVIPGPCHRCVKAKSGLIVVLLKFVLNKGTTDCFVNLSPIVTIFRILVNNDRIHLSLHCGYHGNHFGGNVCLTIDTKLLND